MELSARKRQRKQSTQPKDSLVEQKTDSGHSTRDDSKPVGQGSSVNDQMWGQRLPVLILQDIFHLVVKTEGAVPFLCRACQVCRLWRQVSSDPLLWRELDLSNKPQTHLPKSKRRQYGSVGGSMEWLEQKRFRQLRSIDFGGWTKLTDSGIKELVKHCGRELEEVRLGGCRQLTAKSVRLLIESCTKLHTLDLSSSSPDILSLDSLRHMVKVMSSRLQQLSLADNYLRNLPEIFQAITGNCSNLTALDISNCKNFLAVPIEMFQAACPRLERLQLSHSMVAFCNSSDSKKVVSLGFPKLLELRLAFKIHNVIEAGILVDDDVLLQLCVKSHELRLLDLTKGMQVTAAGIEGLPVDNLQYLYASKSSLCKKEAVETIFRKWRHSLLELDISQIQSCACDLDDCLPYLLGGAGKPVIRDLNIAGNGLTAGGVRCLLEGCPALESLNLCHCLGLPHWMKRSYHGNQLAGLKMRLFKSH